MSDLAAIDYEALGIDDLLGQDRAKPHWLALVHGLATGASAVSTDLLALVDSCDIRVAINAQLDQWGELVGQPRSGMTDTEYRQAITARALANRSWGSRDEVAELVGAVLGVAASACPVVDTPPLAYIVYATVPAALSTAMWSAASRLVRDARPNCVAQDVVVGVAPAFGLDDAALGLDDATLALGGNL